MDEDTREQNFPENEPELDVLEQVEVPFLSDLLLALQGIDGEIYVPIVPLAQRLGMLSPRNQVARIRRDETMAEALRRMPIETGGGFQQTQCLRIDMLTLWLATIRATMVKEEIRATLMQYKREAARAILTYFTAKAQTRRAPVVTTPRPVAPDPDAPVSEWASYYEAMAMLYRQMTAQEATLAQHEQRLDQQDREIAALSDDMISVKEALAIMGETPEPRISIHQANQIQALVSKIHDATGLHQGTIFAAFKKHWLIPRYDELPAVQFDDAYEWLRQWGRARLPQKSK